MEKLSEKKCVPCVSGQPALKGDALKDLYGQLNDGWQLIDDHHLKKSYKFKNFKDALEFTSDVGYLAEEEGHHPEILLTWGKVEIKIWTHKIDGLSESDFILADKCDAAHIGRFGK